MKIEEEEAKFHNYYTDDGTFFLTRRDLWRMVKRTDCKVGGSHQSCLQRAQLAWWIKSDCTNRCYEDPNSARDGISGSHPESSSSPSTQCRTQAHTCQDLPSLQLKERLDCVSLWMLLYLHPDLLIFWPQVASLFDLWHLLMNRPLIKWKHTQYPGWDTIEMVVVQHSSPMSAPCH